MVVPLAGAIRIHQCPQTVGQFQDVGLVERLPQNDVRSGDLWGDAAPVHRRHRAPELLANRHRAAPAFEHVALHAASEAEFRGAIHKNAQIEQFSSGRLMEQPKTLYQNQRLGLPRLALGQAPMPGKIITGQAGGQTAPGIAEDLFKALPVNGLRVVEVYLFAFAGRQVRTIEIEIIQRKTGDIVSQHVLQLAGQPGFAGATAADDAD